MADNSTEKGLFRLDLEEIAEQIRNCTKCRLSGNRTNAVPGEGDGNTDVLFVGEGPGAQEDQQGRPFVGRAGNKLTEILDSVSFQRSEVYITNVVKCRPPENRAPKTDEVNSCIPYLEAQIAEINPSIIVTLGNAATKTLLETDEGITSTRGKFYSWRGEIQIFPMFHPSYLLRNPSKEKGSPKYKTWQDIKKVKKALTSR
ncbi:uracil-DNA glycosylase [Candidatus Bipolaricaulota bacterium]|nr:uracil-DNA glycosylase [Candidatus Bipolaricaulota bacterium]